MILCPACLCEPPEGSRFCPECGFALMAPLGATEAYAVAVTAASATHEEVPSAKILPDGQPRFAPGTTLLGRYRIINIVGFGGMGEVYRADDLRLGQQVALKFLPGSLLND